MYTTCTTSLLQTQEFSVIYRIVELHIKVMLTNCVIEMSGLLS